MLMPPDDPHLAPRNVGLAMRQSEAGKDVVLYQVGVPGPQNPAWREHQVRAIRLQQVKPRWPNVVAPEPGDLAIVSDRGRDVILVDFFGLRREGMGFPLGGGLAGGKRIRGGAAQAGVERARHLPASGQRTEM